MNNYNYVFGFTLAVLILAAFGWLVFNQIKEHHKQNDPMLHDLRETLRPVHPAIDQVRLYEGEKSYTINKERVYICLRDENGQYYNKNMLIYVTLHELAHAINDEIGHTQKFHDIFEELLDKAYSLGIYNPSIPPIQNYCQYND